MLTEDEFNDALADNDPIEVSSSEAYIKLIGDDLTPEQVNQAKWQWEEVVRLDYQEWSGGFPPDSTEKITAYLDYAAPSWLDREEARAVLLASIP